MKYKLFKWIDKMRNVSIKRCKRCGKALSKNECEYYGNNCENCERKFMKIINKEKWDDRKCIYCEG